MTSKVRHRRKKSEMPFADALSAATKRLVKAQREREQAQKSLTSLNAEIPNLQRTIQALQVQLKPGCSSPVERLPLTTMRASDVSNREGVGGSIPPPGAIPEGVTLPADDLTGMGSTRALDEDVLPDAEGQEVLPE